jgi:hypothetical protein
MHKNIITDILNWYKELYDATWEVIDSIENGDYKGELVRETYALFHKVIDTRIALNFWQ